MNETPNNSKLLLVGLNHKTAPLAVREKMTFNFDQSVAALYRWREQHPQTELVLLATCNRVELYMAGEAITDQYATQFLADVRGVPIAQFGSHLYHQTDRAAVEHLFSVVGSLDSMVLGEHQILGQVRDAYQLARDAGAASAMLHPLFQRAIAVGKEIFSTTQLTEGRSSISGVAVGYARQVFERFNDKNVLCIGAGKMVTLALRGLADLKPAKLTIVNRDTTRAQRLAQTFHGHVAPFDQLSTELAKADIVLTSTASVQPIITRKMMEAVLPQRRYRPIFLIDIAVPRDVEPSVGKLDQVYLCNLDDLQSSIAQTQSTRSGAVDSAKQLVTQHVDEFIAWQRQRELGPLIEQLRARIHALADEEVQRSLAAMPHASDAEREAMQQLARRMANQFLHEPIRTLREGGHGHGSPARYLHAVEQLFKLNQARHDPGPADDAE